jgi:hypothetical protein
MEWPQNIPNGYLYNISNDHKISNANKAYQHFPFQSLQKYTYTNWDFWMKSHDNHALFIFHNVNLVIKTTELHCKNYLRPIPTYIPNLYIAVLFIFCVFKIVGVLIEKNA